MEKEDNTQKWMNEWIEAKFKYGAAGSVASRFLCPFTIVGNDLPDPSSGFPVWMLCWSSSPISQGTIGITPTQTQSSA